VNRHRLSSLGAKLAGATVVLIAIVTAAIYFSLSRQERETLLGAKEASASAVTRLFADSCAPAVVFEDQLDLRQNLTTLARNQDVEYAAIWKVDRAGRVTDRLAELARGRSETTPGVPANIQIRRDRDRVVPVAPVRDVKGELVGVVAVAFSLSPENAAISRLERSTLLISVALAAGLSILLVVLARLLVVGPLATLVRAAKRLEEGSPVQIDVQTRDEMGQLAGAFRSMAEAIRVREDRINARNGQMRLVLDNVGQGFISLDLSGAVSEERSRVVDEWFGSLDGSPKLWDCLARLDPDVGQYFEVAWSAVVEQILPMELLFEQLPKIVRKGELTLQLTYRPIFNHGALGNTVVVITDITHRLERERSEQRQREMLSVHRRLTADRPAFDEFFREATRLVQSICGAGAVEASLLRRQVHTLKGNSALFGLESVAALCHTVEDHLGEVGTLDDTDRKRLAEAWDSVTAMRQQLADTGADDEVRVARADYLTVIGELRNQGGQERLVRALESWEFEPAAKRLELIAEQIESTARRLGRAAVDVVRAPTALRLPPHRWGPFWSAFAHLIRNTVDHGVETAAQREARGASPRATVRLEIRESGTDVLVAIEDDGPGIDWAVIAARARALGLPHATPEEVERSLFADGVSSRAEATATSGRGVGLGVVVATVRDLGGRVEVCSEAGRGTSFFCWLPDMLSADRAQAQPGEPAVPLAEQWQQ
jgi:two-component system chemotaxis sensor kinase CheA